MGFLGGSDGKESACIVGDLDWEDPLEKGTATQLQHSDLEKSMDREGYSPWGCKELDMTELLSLHHFSTPEVLVMCNVMGKAKYHGLRF